MKNKNIIYLNVDGLYNSSHTAFTSLNYLSFIILPILISPVL